MAFEIRDNSKDENVEKISNKNNIIALLIIASLSIMFWGFSTVVIPLDDELDGLELALILSYSSCAVAALLVAKRYNWISHIFGKTHLALGIGWTLVVMGEITWLYYAFTGQDPYPSIADIFYFGFYPLAIFHLARNCHYFKPKFSRKEKAFLVICSLSIISIYSYISINEGGEINFDFYYGLIPVSISATALSFAIIGAKILRGSDLGIAWLLLASGIFMTTLSDVWYYVLEIFDGYNTSHPTNALWFGAGLLVTYALIKHRKVM